MTFLKLTKFAATLLFTLTLNVAAATPVKLTSFGSFDNFLFLSSGALHYQTNAAENTLLILEGRVAEGTVVPLGWEAVQNDAGLLIKFPEAYRVTLSPDERRLQIERVAAIRAANLVANDPLRTDERAPLIYPLANAAPSTVAAQLSQLYPNLKVVVDERQRSLLIVANPTDRALIEALVKYLDTTRPQISFEAEVLEINRGVTTKLGIDYDFIFKLGLKETDIPTPGGGQPFRLGTIVRDTQQGLGLSATINLLQSNGAGKILARPRVVSLDGVEARINATQNTPLVVTNNNAQSVQNIATGITLRMLPRIAPDGAVEVQVTISVSAPTGVTAQGVPTFSSREANTTVRVQSGEPIVIGGLLENRRIEGTNKVPILGDLPLIGGLFRSTTVNTSETDLVIIITPRMLSAVKVTSGAPGVGPAQFTPQTSSQTAP